MRDNKTNTVHHVTHHVLNVVAGFMIVWGFATCITAHINYICLPTLILGIIIYYGNNEGEL